jgi:hypothetical protein
MRKEEKFICLLGKRGFNLSSGNKRLLFPLGHALV